MYGSLNNPRLSFAVPSPRLAPPSYRDRGYAASPKYPKEAVITHPIQRKHFCDTFPITDSSLVKSLNCKAVFFIGGYSKPSFPIDFSYRTKIYSVKRSAQAR